MSKPRENIVYIPKQQTGKEWFGVGRYVDYKQKRKVQKQREKQALRNKL